METFFQSALSGKTIADCIADADRRIGDITYTTDYGTGTCYGLPVHKRGDESQYLYFGG
jgi:hypothetical protein